MSIYKYAHLKRGKTPNNALDFRDFAGKMSYEGFYCYGYSRYGRALTASECKKFDLALIRVEDVRSI